MNITQTTIKFEKFNQIHNNNVNVILLYHGVSNIYQME